MLLQIHDELILEFPKKDVFGNFVEKNKWDIILIHGVQGPWRMKCKDMINKLITKFKNLQILIQTPIGIIPYFLEDLNPFSHINGPSDIWNFNEEDLNFGYNNLAKIHGSAKPNKVVEELIQYGFVQSELELNDDEIETYFDKYSIISKTALFTQLNFEVAENWLYDSTYLKGGTNRIRNVFDSSGEHVLSPRLEDGGITLTVKGAKKLFDYSKDNKCQIPIIKVDEGAVPFVSKGRNVMHGFINSVTGTLRPGMPCLVIDDNDELIAHGVCCCTNSEAIELKKGIAVKIKSGIE